MKNVDKWLHKKYPDGYYFGEFRGGNPLNMFLKLITQEGTALRGDENSNEFMESFGPPYLGNTPEAL